MLIIDLPAPVVSTSYTACLGVAFDLYASDYNADYDYKWTGPGGTFTTDNLYFNPVTAGIQGNYKVEVSSPGCNPASSNFRIVVNTTKPAKPVISTPSTFCEGGSINLATSNGNASLNYGWFGPNGFTENIPNPVISPASAANEGVYKVVFIDNNGCPGDTTSKTLTMTKSAAAATITGDTVLCEGNPLNLVSTFAGTSTQFEWITPTGTVTTRNLNIPAVTLNHTGEYSFKYLSGGCFSLPAKINVSVTRAPDAPIPVASKSIYCELDLLELFVPDIAGETYRWKGPNGFTDSSAHVVRAKVLQVDAGTYSVIAYSGKCGSLPGSIVVTIKPTPKNPELTTNAPVCARTLLTVGSNNRLPGITYTWTRPSGDTSTSDELVYPKCDHSDDGFYLMNASLDGCTAPTDTIYVKVKERIDRLDYSMTQLICENYSFDIILGKYEDTKYWIFKNSSTHVISSQRLFHIDSIKTSFSGNYIFKAQNTCDTLTLNIPIIVNPAPVFVIVGDSGICDYEQRVLRVKETGQDLTYLWNTFETLDKITIDTAGLYFVVGTSLPGCTTRVEHPVTVLCKPEVYVPNAFSPNGDGHNDLFKVELHNVVEFKLAVFSRSGVKVFESLDPEKGWDGTFNGKRVDDGMYIYSLKYKTNYHYEIFEDLQEGKLFVIR